MRQFVLLKKQIECFIFMEKFITREKAVSSSQSAATADKADEPPKKVQKNFAHNSNRIFNVDWENKFFVIESNGKPFCLICKTPLSRTHSYNVQRHYNSNHKIFDEKYASADCRQKKLTELKKELSDLQKNINKALTASQIITLASFEISWILARHKKNFSDAEFVKECFLSGTDILASALKEKNEIMSRIRNLQLSRWTAARRIAAMGDQIVEDLKTRLKDCLYFSIALDESVDISDTAQLCTWIRFVNIDLTVCEELLAMRGLHDRTRGVDIYNSLWKVLREYEINDTAEIVSVTTDGAPAMVGVHSGCVAMLKKKFPSLIAIHCIIHQENLCSKFSNGRLTEVMQTVVSIVNLIRSKSLNHRQFKLMLEEIDTEYADLILHTDIRWLSRGKVLERFISLLQPICDFLDSKGIKNYDECLCSVEWIRDLSFLCDITSKLNDLNLLLQGKNKTVTEMFAAVNAFSSKLDLYISQISHSELKHFKNLQESVADEPHPPFDSERYCSWLRELAENFKERFEDFKQLSSAFQFFREPVRFPIDKVKDLCAQFNFDSVEVENELIELQANNSPSESADWSNISFYSLRLIAAKIMAMFGSTYLCESTFSTVTTLKNKLRSRITDGNLESSLHCALTSVKPNISNMVKLSDSQISH